MVKAIWEEYRGIIVGAVGIIAAILIGVGVYYIVKDTGQNQANATETYVNSVVDQLESETN